LRAKGYSRIFNIYTRGTEKHRLGTKLARAFGFSSSYSFEDCEVYTLWLKP
jgi:hypothetical protein